MHPLVVGFDLDMTLIDTRAGIAAVWDTLAAETGVVIDSALASRRLGPPLDEELAVWFAPEQVAPMGERFRAIYPDVAIEPTQLLRGAREAVHAVRRHGGRVIVVTAKYEPNARLHLEHLGLEVDEVVGWRWGPGKGESLKERGASIYVGDHVADVLGARVAGALSVAVPTGPVSSTELAAAGADVVLTGLHEFPAWLERHLSDRSDQRLADRASEEVLEGRLRDLDASLRRLRSVLVAFSGGADSAFLLAAAVRALGPDKVMAATAVSDSLPTAELVAAREFSATLGVRLLTPGTSELERPGYRANAGDRCYFCKAELLDVLTPLAQQHGLACVVTGTNADDAVAGFRPGIRAAHERGAQAPLRDCGFTKAQVRAASSRWGLATWDKPAAACLASRIAYGTEVTPQRLARVEQAEALVRQALLAAGMATRDVRVRDLGEAARLEVDAPLVVRLEETPHVLDAVLEAVRSAGFEAAALDARGFRSGAMNEMLPDPARYR